MYKSWLHANTSRRVYSSMFFSFFLGNISVIKKNMSEKIFLEKKATAKVLTKCTFCGDDPPNHIGRNCPKNPANNVSFLFCFCEYKNYTKNVLSSNKEASERCCANNNNNSGTNNNNNSNSTINSITGTINCSGRKNRS